MGQVGAIRQEREVETLGLPYGGLEAGPRGELEITFPDGLLGFPHVKRYALVDATGAAPFKWLKAVDVPDLAFVVVDPREFRPSYRLAITAAELRELQLERPEDADVYVLTVIPSDPRMMTANLRGPLVINRRLGTGKQVVLLSNEYSTSHLILEEMTRTLSNSDQ